MLLLLNVFIPYRKGAVVCLKSGTRFWGQVITMKFMSLNVAKAVKFQVKKGLCFKGATVGVLFTIFESFKLDKMQTPNLRLNVIL